ncbi:MAG TPA: hypothetical protein PLE51_01875 [Candidatus Pacearchaeota archaeon]|nr:hypothetical protein [Candidatus Pacearchaeota archaeon]HOR52392.1 hypothetical protein [Candidatus Pacearchaeota archaeon]HPJ86488.1 hypothetical protein [Candidatus Pacearchaeota archaeon]HQF82653.1 hypothetical protein [Candidatus Pacearchaeota archaeon]HQI57684.1 hypothetical protein [Candidatus Pacearchaeota archaeon]
MRFKDIFLTGALTLSTILPSFSQDKLNYEVRTKGGGFPATTSFINLSEKEIDFSFLLGIYSMKFNQINDSTYNETKNFMFKKEFFDYAKGSGYILLDYSVEMGRLRNVKEKLINQKLDEKYKTFPEILKDFREDGFKDKDSLHFFLMGLPYSLKIDKIESGDTTFYSSGLNEAIKFEPGDDFHFSYPIEMTVVEKEGKRVIIGFSTRFLNVKKRKEGSLEGRLK